VCIDRLCLGTNTNAQTSLTAARRSIVTDAVQLFLTLMQQIQSVSFIDEGSATAGPQWCSGGSVLVSDIAIFVLKRDVKLQLTN